MTPSSFPRSGVSNKLRALQSASYADLWQAQRLVLRALGGDGQADLALPALGGLFDPEDGRGEPLLDAELANDAFLAAVRDLAWLPTTGQRLQPVDYRNLGAEELGSVYEALLELVPRVSVEDHRFALEHLSGNERKTTGSYYTPPGLVSALLDTALDPVLDDAVAGARTAQEAEQRLLALTVCDPACGSGHFIVAAARRIAQRLASVRSGEDEPTPADVRHALRDVVGRCVYGVDLNPLAAELAKVSLWLEAVEPGKALGFLDARIRVGNSLLGTTPALLAAGVPDEAFKPLEGDDRQVATAVRKRNSAERGAYGHGQDQLDLDLDATPTHTLAQKRASLLQPQDDAASVRALARRWRDYEQSVDYLDRKAHADAWAAAFVWPLVPAPARTVDAETPRHVQPPTSAIVRRLGSEPHATTLAPVRAEVERLADEYRFFHWHLEFPEVFDRPDAGVEGWAGGFDAVVGNPPWEHIELKEQEYFAGRDPEVAAAAGARRKKLIAALAHNDPRLFAHYNAEKRRLDGLRKFASESGVYPLTGRGRVKTDSVFAELFRSLTGPRGQAGIIVPTGIATDATTQYFFKDLVETRSLAALFDFENASPLFEGVHRSFKFCLLTMSGRSRPNEAATFAFFLHDPLGIDGTHFSLTPEEIALLNPNTGTLPIFRTRRDAEITLGIFHRVPVLIRQGDPNGNRWGTSFMQGLFNMTSDSGLFRTRDELEADGWALRGNIFARSGSDARMLPLQESKMFHQYDPRWATYGSDGSVRDVTVAEKRDPHFVTMPRYWVPEGEVRARLTGRWSADWTLVWRGIARSTDARTTIASIAGSLAGGGNYDYMFPRCSPAEALFMLAALNSYAFDFCARQKLTGMHLQFSVMSQLPMPLADEADPTGLSALVKSAAYELSYTSKELAPLARALGDMGEPFAWNSERRHFLRAEIDGALLHAYGLSRPEAEYILDTFPIEARKDIATYGEHRTKRLILEVYDAMQKAIDTGTEYLTILDPPPGHGPRHPASPQTTSTSRGMP